MGRVTSRNVDQFLMSGENETVEFKLRVPPPDLLARELAAFANTQPGTVLIGVREPGHPVGADLEDVKRAVSQAMRFMTPPPAVEVYEVTCQGQPIVAVDVNASNAPVVLRDGRVMMRLGATIQAASARDIADFLSKQRTQVSTEDLLKHIDNLTGLVTGLTQRVVDLQANVVESGTVSKKAPDWLWSGLIGTILGVAATLLLKLFGL